MISSSDEPYCDMKPSIRILLIDESTERAIVLTQILKGCGYDNVVLCEPTDNLIDYVNELNPQVILIDVLSPSRDTLEQLTTIRDEHPTPVVLMSQDDRVQSIKSALESGVTAYVSNEVTCSQAKLIIDTAMLTFATFQDLKHELDDAKMKLVNQKLVERAKGLLMSDYNLTEEVAYQKLRKFAMDQKQPMSDVARQIIDLKKLTS